MDSLILPQENSILPRDITIILTLTVLDSDYSVWCKFQPNNYPCVEGSPRSRFYYDIKMKDCKTFLYQQCPTAFNNFNTLSECQSACLDIGEKSINYNMSDAVLCRLQPDFGTCDGYHPMWYYDIDARNCRGFSWSGCGGNFNRFESQQLCTSVCIAVTGF